MLLESENWNAICMLFALPQSSFHFNFNLDFRGNTYRNLDFRGKTYPNLDFRGNKYPKFKNKRIITFIVNTNLIIINKMFTE